MRKCIKTRFRPLQTLKNIFFRVVWKHAQMHQNTFSTTPDTKKYLFQGHVSGGHVFDHSRHKNFFFRVVWNHAKMPQNTFLITPDVEKNLFQGHVSGGLEACANASKHVFNHSRR
jgi:hypothetical protein